MDGMALSFKKDQSRIVHPWLEDPEGELFYGSHFQDRVFVQRKDLRAQLLSFSYKGEWFG